MHAKFQPSSEVIPDRSLVPTVMSSVLPMKLLSPTRALLGVARCEVRGTVVSSSLATGQKAVLPPGVASSLLPDK